VNNEEETERRRNGKRRDGETEKRETGDGETEKRETEKRRDGETEMRETGNGETEKHGRGGGAGPRAESRGKMRKNENEMIR
jgi:hypothetical protein